MQLLRDGHRMECPQSCPAEVYYIMRECWAADPANRPTFSKLIDDLDRILTYQVRQLNRGLLPRGVSNLSSMLPHDQSLVTLQNPLPRRTTWT